MNMTVLRHPLVLKALLALCLLVGVAWAAAAVYQRHQAMQTTLDDLEPRYARLLGLIAKEPEIRAADGAVQAALAQWAYPASRDASQTGNEAQQRIRELLSQAGLDVVSSQVLPAQETRHFDYIPLVFRVSGEPVALHTALAVLAAAKPAVWLDNWSMQGAPVARGATSGAPRLSAELRLTVLRGRS